MGVRDLVNVGIVNVGIFTVINYVLFFVIAFTGVVPVMTVFYTVLLTLVASIPNVLFFKKN